MAADNNYFRAQQPLDTALTRVAKPESTGFLQWTIILGSEGLLQLSISGHWVFSNAETPANTVSTKPSFTASIKPRGCTF
jgi:hypothetical protein